MNHASGGIVLKAARQTRNAQGSGIACLNRKTSRQTDLPV